MNKKILSLAVVAAMLISVLSVVSFADDLPDRCFPNVMPKAYKVPVIDGHVDPNEGWGAPLGSMVRSEMTEENGALNGNMDADEESFADSITVWYRWDETNIYFAAEVVEQIFENFCDSEDNAYAGDGFQWDIATDFDRATRDVFFIAMNSEDGTIWTKANSIEDGAPWDDIAAPGTLVITRDEATKLTTYEYAVPWADAVNTEWKAEIGAHIQVRPLLLCNPNDELDINVVGSTEDGLAFWYCELTDYAPEDVAQFAETEAPAPEPAPAAEATPAETAAPAAAAPAETAAPAAETAAPAPAAAPAAPSAAAQTGDMAGVVILAAVAALGSAVVIAKKH